MDCRLTFQEIMRLAPLPPQSVEDEEKGIRRYMSVRAAFPPGADLAVSHKKALTPMIVAVLENRRAFGGHVFAQSGIAAARALRELQDKPGSGMDGKQYGIHTIHGYFSEIGLVDRPFIYEVTPQSKTPNFINMQVTARQPQSPSTNQQQDHYPPADADLPLGDIRFTSIVSLRPSDPRPGLSLQEPPPQTRFAAVLASRRPGDWIPAPPIDIDAVTARVPRWFAGDWPALEMRKVDMRAFNGEAGRPLHERRELILYRLLEPLDAADVAAHAMVHAYESDRNGFLMAGNLVGIGFRMGRVASLSNSFVVHVNPGDAVMEGEGEGWWVQEACYPRVEAGRAVMHCKIWSPGGVHVASCYQDGILREDGRAGSGGGRVKL